MVTTNMRRMLHAGAPLTVLLLIVLSACGPAKIKPFAAANLRSGDGAKMAISPFDNLSNTQGAAKSMESMVLIEFLKRSTIKVVDPGEVSAALSKERVRLATNMSRETIRTVGARLGVRFLMMGTIHQYDMQAAGGPGVSGNLPFIAVTLRVVDTDSGDIVWACNATRRGNDRETVFAIGRVLSLNTLAEEMSGELAQAFADSLRNQSMAALKAASSARPVIPNAVTPKEETSPGPATPSDAVMPKIETSSGPTTPSEAITSKATTPSEPVTPSEAATPEVETSSGSITPSEAITSKATTPSEPATTSEAAMPEVETSSGPITPSETVTSKAGTPSEPATTFDDIMPKTETSSAPIIPSEAITSKAITPSEPATTSEVAMPEVETSSGPTTQSEAITSRAVTPSEPATASDEIMPKTKTSSVPITPTEAITSKAPTPSEPATPSYMTAGDLRKFEK